MMSKELEKRVCLTLRVFKQNLLRNDLTDSLFD